MDNIQSTYKDMDDDDDGGGGGDRWFDALDQIPNPSSSPSPLPLPEQEIADQRQQFQDQEEEEEEEMETEDEPVKSNLPIDEIDNDNDDDDNAIATSKKQKPLSSFTPSPNPTKKPKKKTNNNVWAYKSTSRKGKKKSKPSPASAAATAATPADKVQITPVPRVPDRSDDSPTAAISLSKVHKAERVELSEDRLVAASGKGYRMVRATRGVDEGHWYFEIRVLKLGPTGHSRLGWCTEKGDLQAPVGYDRSSYGYRDSDGSKVHKAVRAPYGDEGYGEGDVIGFYIALPEGDKYVPKVPHLVWYKGQRCYTTAGKDESPKVVPGSEISFYKNGLCQGTAFKDLFGGRYYPAASMYTMPNEPNCEVRFNFGPDFDFFPQDFGGRQTPRPMVEVPYYEYDLKVGVPMNNGIL